MLETPSGKLALGSFLLIWGGVWFSQIFMMMFRPDSWIRWSNWGNGWFGLELVVVERERFTRYVRGMGLFMAVVGVLVVAGILFMESVHP